jgi:hypothetical protein
MAQRRESLERRMGMFHRGIRQTATLTESTA